MKGRGAALAQLEQLLILSTVNSYHARKADLLRLLGRGRDAALAYGRAIDLAEGLAERRFLEERLASFQD